MSILSDREIKSFCDLPKYELIYLTGVDDGKHYLTEEEAKSKNLPVYLRNQTVAVANNNAYLIELSNEERLNFKPMIYPFIDHQVRDRNVYYLQENSINDLYPFKPFKPDRQGDDDKLKLVPGKEKILSYGLDSYGYDVRLDSDIKLFTNINSEVVNPKNLDERCLTSARIIDENGSKYFLLPPNSYALGKTVEHFNMPNNVTAFCLGKSTYARCGIIINPTSFKAGFSGSIVIEIANTCNLPVKIFINEGIASCTFFRGSSCEIPYNGNYQNQTGVQLPEL